MTTLKSICLAMLLVMAGVVGPTNAAPPAGPAPAGTDATAAVRDLISPAATRLCGRGLSGRCTRGRAACTHGDAAACAKWKAWNEACSTCAAAFAKCRNNPRKSCTSCVAEHDACEAKAR